jgi:hypothetical protein
MSVHLLHRSLHWWDLRFSWWQVWRWLSCGWIAFMMDAVSTFETSAYVYQTSWCNNPEDSCFHHIVMTVAMFCIVTLMTLGHIVDTLMLVSILQHLSWISLLLLISLLHFVTSLVVLLASSLMWHKEHYWNFGVLQEYTFPVLFILIIFLFINIWKYLFQISGLFSY